MSITAIDQQPPVYSPAYNENIFLVTSSATAQANFRYVFDVYATDGTTLIARLKPPARPGDSRGLLDVKRIIENYLSYTLPDERESAGFYQNAQTFYKYSVKVGEEYGAGTPVVYPAQMTVTGLYIFNGGYDWLDFIDYLYTDYLITAGGLKPFLSNAPSTQRIETSQNAWLGMMTALSGTIRTAELRKYNSADTLLGVLTINNTFQDITGGESHRFLRLAIGTANIEAYSAGWLTGVDHYTAQILDSSSGTASVLRQYNIVDGNCKYDTVRLQFLNKYGGFDAFNFTLKSRESLAITKQQYKKRYGSTTGTSWSYTSSDRGDVVFDSRGKQSFRIISDWISEAESTWLEELLTSPEVYQELDADTLIGVVVKTSTYEKKKKQNQSLFNLELEFEYSFEKIRQRG